MRRQKKKGKEGSYGVGLLLGYGTRQATVPSVPSTLDLPARYHKEGKNSGRVGPSPQEGGTQGKAGGGNEGRRKKRAKGQAAGRRAETTVHEEGR